MPTNNERQKAYNARRRAAIQSIKLDRGCMDCGYREQACALDFDHRPGSVKKFSVGHEGVRSKSMDSILAEIEKCDVVCANCHRVRTEGRRGH